MKTPPFIEKKYFASLPSSVARLWNMRETLRFRNIRCSRLQYFFVFPLAMIFANLQEVLFISDVRLFGLDASTLSSVAYCLGALIIYIFSGKKNISVISRLSAILCAGGVLMWIILPDGVPGFAFAMVFMAGIGGCAVSGGYAYAFVLNNTERFFGAVLITLFYGLTKIVAGIPLPSPVWLRISMLLTVAGSAVCSAAYRQADFEHVQTGKDKKTDPAVGLMMYFFISMYFTDAFNSYIPGAAEPATILICGVSGVAAVLLCVLMQFFLRRSVWTICNLFFIALVGSFALLYAPDGSFLRVIAASLHGLQLTGYLAGLYLLGCVLNKSGDFRMFKQIVAVVMLVGVLAYLVPDLLADMPLVLHATAMIVSVILFVVFLMLSPAYSSYLFSADWSDDLRRLTMSRANRQTGQTDMFRDLKLTPREKEIAILLMQGYSVKQIAADIGISFDTAKYHIKNLYKKLGIGSRYELHSRLASSGNDIRERDGV